MYNNVNGWIFLIKFLILLLKVVAIQNEDKKTDVQLLMQPLYLNWSSTYLDINSSDIVGCPSFDSGKSCYTKIKICIASCENEVKCYAEKCFVLTGLKKEWLTKKDFVNEGFPKPFHLEQYSTNTKYLRINMNFEPYKNDGKAMRKLAYQTMFEPKFCSDHKHLIEITEKEEEYTNFTYNFVNFSAEIDIVCEKNYYGCFCEERCKMTENFACDMCSANFYPKNLSDVQMCQTLHPKFPFSMCVIFCSPGSHNNHISFCDFCGRLQCRTGYKMTKENNDCEQYNCKYQKRDVMCKNCGQCKSTNHLVNSTKGFFECDCSKIGFTGPFCERATVFNNNTNINLTLENLSWNTYWINYPCHQTLTKGNNCLMDLKICIGLCSPFELCDFGKVNDKCITTPLIIEPENEHFKYNKCYGNESVSADFFHQANIQKLFFNIPDFSADKSRLIMDLFLTFKNGKPQTFKEYYLTIHYVLDKRDSQLLKMSGSDVTLTARAIQVCDENYYGRYCQINCVRSAEHACKDEETDFCKENY